MTKRSDNTLFDLLIDQYGGMKQMASDTKISRQTLWKWRKNGITPRGRFVLSHIAREKQIALPSDFMEG